MSARAAFAHDRRAALVVWLIWAAAFGGALLYVALYGSDVPHLDEWQMIGPAATRCPRSTAWFFAANNEHRIPLPKAVYCGLMLISGSDFRSGMITSVVLFAGAAAVLILGAARARGRSSVADAFFPLLLLHWGHAENFLHSFQIAFTLPVALVAVLGSAMLVSRGVPGVMLATGAALCAAALPFCSMVGLALTPPVVLWLVWSAYAASHDESRRASCAILLAGALACATATVLLVANAPPAGTIPPSPGPIADLHVFADLVLNGLGPAAFALPTLYLTAAIGIALVAVYLLVRGLGSEGPDLRRTVGLLLSLLMSVLLLAGIAHARAGFGASSGSVSRYVSVASLLYLDLFLLTLTRPSRSATRLQMALLLLVVSVIPGNERIGRETGRDLAASLGAVAADARAGATPALLAERYRERLLPWASTGQLTYLLSRLEVAKAGPYRFLRSSTAPAPVP